MKTLEDYSVEVTDVAVDRALVSVTHIPTGTSAAFEGALPDPDSFPNLSEEVKARMRDMCLQSLRDICIAAIKQELGA